MHLQWNCVHRTQRTLVDPLVHLARPLLLWPMGSLLVSAFRPLWTVDSVVCVLAYPVPIVLRIKIRAESWARNGNNMFLSCSHHVPIMPLFPARGSKGGSDPLPAKPWSMCSSSREESKLHLPSAACFRCHSSTKSNENRCKERMTTDFEILPWSLCHIIQH